MTLMELAAGPAAGTAALMLLGLGVAVLLFAAAGFFAPIEKSPDGPRLAVASTYGGVLVVAALLIGFYFGV